MADENEFVLMHCPALKPGNREARFPNNPRVIARKQVADPAWVIGPDPEVEKQRKAAEAARAKAEADAAKAAEKQSADENKGA